MSRSTFAYTHQCNFAVGAFMVHVFVRVCVCGVWCVVFAQVGVAASGASKAISVAALGWKQHLIAGGLARGVAVCILYMCDMTHSIV